MTKLPGYLEGIVPGTLELPVPAFYFLRHGRTAHNHRRLMQGHMDVPLDETGREEADAAARLIAGQGIVRRIAASDLSRALQTAAAVGAATGLPVDHDPGLRERGFGGLEGLAIAEGCWDRQDDGIEPMAAFAGRVADAVRRHAVEPGALLVAHGGVLRVLARLLDAALPDGALGNAVPLAITRAGGAWRIGFVAEPATPPGSARPLTPAS